MKRRIVLLAAVAALVLLAACSSPSPSSQDTSPVIEATGTPEVEAAEPVTPEPSAETVKTVPWALPDIGIVVNVPETWNLGAQLLESLTESPDVDHFYAVSFAPEGVSLSQDANIGFFYIVKDSIWDAQNGRVTDIAVNEIGRANGYVVGYSGSSDNPYVLGTEACDLFDQMMVSTSDAMDILTVEPS